MISCPFGLKILKIFGFENIKNNKNNWIVVKTVKPAKFSLYFSKV